MPEFLIEFMDDLNEKSTQIKERFEDKKNNTIYETIFQNYWINYDFLNLAPNQNVIAVDSSRGTCPTYNGGFFFICRGLALGQNLKYKTIYTDFDYSNIKVQSEYVDRVMEFTEHLAAIESLKAGFKGTLLVDGSLFGRMSHIPIELKVENNKGFMIDYFNSYLELLRICKEKEVLIVGLSKESRTSFFREFLLKNMLLHKISDINLAKKLLTTALDNPNQALKIANSIGDSYIIQLTKELISRKPDSMVIINNVATSGYTCPLLLGANTRLRRAEKQIKVNLKGFIDARFPNLSEDNEFCNYAQKVIFDLLEFPAIVSFHILPKIIDTPIRVDIPSWYFNINKKFLEVGWPEPLDIDLTKILNLISAGYLGLDNYNIWLTAADQAVRLIRKDFEELYLKKFEDLIKKKSTPRGYRRVKIP